MKHAELSPQGFFEQRFGPSITEAQIRRKWRDDLGDIPADFIAKSPQHVCDHVRKVVASLLHADEVESVGNFYFGLTDEPKFSATIEAVGASYLILIHRRLFNGLQFASDVTSNLQLTPQKKAQLLAEYLHRVVTSFFYLRELPSPPRYGSQVEAFEASSKNGSLLRFVLCHEVGHELQSLPEARSYVRRFPEIQSYPDPWRSELVADYLAACIPMRLSGLEEPLASKYIDATLAAPFIFYNLMQVVECLRRQGPDSDSRTGDDHPPSALRASCLMMALSQTFQNRREYVVKVAKSVGDFFHSVLEYGMSLQTKEYTHATQHSSTRECR